MKNICHITTVHSRFDTRIFLKECISLTKLYKVFLIVADRLGRLEKWVEQLKKEIAEI